jgi:hypothetical protein
MLLWLLLHVDEITDRFENLPNNSNRHVLMAYGCALAVSNLQPWLSFTLIIDGLLERERFSRYF